MIDWNYVDNFEEHEFDCKCGCGLNNINKLLVYKLDLARMISYVPFVINRGSSCVEHNKSVDGEDDSSHLYGLGVDISTPNSSVRFKVVSALLSVGFERIGVYEHHVHVDIDTNKFPTVMWYK